jgi:hypothetical protein
MDDENDERETVFPGPERGADGETRENSSLSENE